MNKARRRRRYDGGVGSRYDRESNYRKRPLIYRRRRDYGGRNSVSQSVSSSGFYQTQRSNGKIPMLKGSGYRVDFDDQRKQNVVEKMEEERRCGGRIRYAMGDIMKLKFSPKCLEPIIKVRKMAISGFFRTYLTVPKEEEVEIPYSLEIDITKGESESKGILNRINCKNYNKLRTKLLGLDIFRHEDGLKMVVDLLYHYAVRFPEKSGMYAGLCESLSKNHGEVFNVRKALLLKCKSRINNSSSDDDDLGDECADEREKKRKDRMRGNLIFISSLFNETDLLSFRDVLEIIDELMMQCVDIISEMTFSTKSITKEEKKKRLEIVPSLCLLLTRSGKELEGRRRRSRKSGDDSDGISRIFNFVEDISNMKSIPIIYRCLAKDVIELRKRKWRVNEISRFN